MNKENNCGIYKIESILNSEMYIGASSELLRRERFHFSTLKNNCHTNKNLQNHANEFGVNDLKFIILELCDKKKLTKTEQFYIDKLNPEFNIMRKAGSCIHRKTTIETRIGILNDIIKESVKYSQSFRKAYCYRESENFIIIEQEMKNTSFPNFTTKIPVSDISDVIVRERAKLVVHNNYEPKGLNEAIQENDIMDLRDNIKKTME